MIRVYNDLWLDERNSFHVHQRAARLLEFDEAEELPQLFQQYAPQQWTVLAGGNNLLFTQDYPATLITPCGRRITLLGEDDHFLEVRAEAGVEWDELVQWCVAHGAWGMENLSLIPGKVGAAPVQNIGAYGAEAKDTIVRVETFAPETHNFLTLAAEHCAFGYRESVFKHSLRGRVIITAVEFRLSKTPTPRIGYGDVEAEVERLGGATLQNIREAVCTIRRHKLPDPAVTGNAGSFFKNPIVPNATAKALRSQYPDMPAYPAAQQGYTKLAAGWLIDRAGLKGARHGRVGIHDRQALVVINLGGATGSEVLDFAHEVQQTVRAKFGVDIDTEVNIL